MTLGDWGDLIVQLGQSLGIVMILFILSKKR